ncbi:MAG: DUF4294 domain-containing protein [Candidatus Scalindua sp.]|nr:DUF4294 domain-containing protein [Candidatus Scalindua sp.]
MKPLISILFLVFWFCNNTLVAQIVEKDNIPLSERYIVFKGDTLLIELDEVQLLKKLKFNTNYDRRYYYWFRKKVLKAYPFARLAADRLETLNERLEKIKSKKKKKQYTKRIQKYMEGEFTDQLKKLTRTEGRILIKLIHRQTGIVAFDLVKEYRSGWKAFWYNTTAKMFKLSLKDKYDPLNIDEDYMIEDILQRAFINETLDNQPSKLPISYFELDKNEINAPIPSKKK